MPEAHKRFGGSSAYRWLACPASIQLGERCPRSATNTAAEWGTACHTLAENIWHGRVHHFNMTEAQAALIDEEMYETARFYLSAIRDIGRGGEMEVMLTIPDTAAGDAIGGTADYLYYDGAEKMLHVVDLKTGRNYVSEDSPQLRFYALAAFLTYDKFDIRAVACTIVQPRALGVDESAYVRTMEFSAADLLGFYDDVCQAVEKALAQAPEALPGDHCKYCDACAICPVYEQVSLEPFRVLRDGQVYTAPESLDVGRIATLLAEGAAMQAYFNGLQEYVEQLMLSGTAKIPGLKVVEKVGRRKIVSNKDDILAFTRSLFIPDEEVAPPTLLGVTALEKALKSYGADKAVMDEFYLNHTLKESSGLTIAPESDRREAVAVEAPTVNMDGLEEIIVK